MQTRKQSAIEVLVNIATGFLISLFGQKIILPLLSIDATTSENFTIALFFTALSVVRSYCLRRIFNWWAHR